jgi:hypothetical protein
LEESKTCRSTPHLIHELEQGQARRAGVGDIMDAFFRAPATRVGSIKAINSLPMPADIF